LKKIIIVYRRYDDIEKIIENANINLQSQKNKLNEVSNKYNNFNIKLNTIKDKVNKLPIGTIITINGIKKKFKGKIENTVNKIKMVEQEYNEYCEKQIDWAKSIIGEKYNYNEIINLLDIFNKLNKNYKSDDSSDDELSLIFNDLKENKNKEYKIICNLGKYFIDNNIEDKSQIKDIIKNYKKELKHYDANKENKQNRFISTCKRIYLLSQKININDIVKSNCMTFIRDINNDKFNDLLKLIDNNNKNE
jgi:flagellar biosynthesis chaperone FliJ